MNSIVDFPRFVGGRAGLYIAATMERFRTPKRIPGFGILADVELNGGDLETIYVVDPEMTETVRRNIDKIASNVESGICADKNAKFLFSDGVRFIYKYLGPDKTALGSFTIDSCPD